METIRRDVHLALRLMQHAPGFTASVVAMLTLAIGATAAAFSVVYGVLLRPLPHIDTNRWANLYERPLNEGLDGNLAVSVPNYRDWTRDSKTFAEMVLWWPWSFNIAGDDHAPERLSATPHVHFNVVSTGYAEALGVPLSAGRPFNATDTATSLPVVVINDALARRYFPNQDPIGQQLWVGHAQALPTLPRRTVIGAVGDARWSGLDEPAGPEAWVPLSQQTGTDDMLRTIYLVFHASGDPAALMPAVRARIAQVDADLPLTSVRTLSSRLGESVWRQRLAAAALGVLGLAALTVALIGVFAVTSYLVGRRSHEMGVRLALGARPQSIVHLVLTESGWLVLTGVALGALGAFGAARLLSSLLYGVSAADAATFVATAVGMSVAAMLACYVPARRASRVDPLVTLRTN